MEPSAKSYILHAIFGTIFFHGVLLVLLLMLGMHTQLPLPEEEGVLIALGAVDVGTGQIIPNQTLPATTPPPPVRGEEEVVTQDTEESVAIPPPARRPRTQPQPQPAPRAQTTPRQPAAQQQTPEEPSQQVDQRALFPAGSQRGATTPNQGTGTGAEPGTIGRPTGTPEGAGLGAGQSSVSFSLEGRNPSGNLPLPTYNVGAHGSVVVTITVDRNGRVIRAVPGARGTTTYDTELRRLAAEAAMRARFDPKVDAPVEQVGTITYFFIRQN